MITQGAAGLLLDPGLGKTSITLAASKILLDKHIIRGVLVIAPLRPAKLTWPAEVKKWAQFNNLDLVLLHGKDKDKLLAEKHDIYVINPEGLSWLLQPKWDRKTPRLSVQRMTMLMQKFDMLVIDESTKFKGYDSQRFKMIKASLQFWRRRYILTGTPSPNGIEDLWAQIYILDGGHALTPFITHFRNTYMYVPPGASEYDRRPFPGAEEKIAAKIDHLVLRLKASDYLQLPELVYNEIKVELPAPMWKHYRELENEFLLKLQEGVVTVANCATLSNKLRQLVSGALYLPDKEGIAELHTTKIDALVDLVEELSGQPLLVGYDFVFEKDMIAEALPATVFLDGRNDQPKIEAFNRGDIQVLAGNPASVGHGLNLQQACAHVAYLSLTWNLENFDQFIKRVLRQGNKALRVMCHMIIAANTVDEHVWKTLQNKNNTQISLLSQLRSSIIGSVVAVPPKTEFLS